MPATQTSALESVFQLLQRRGLIAQATPGFVAGVSRFKLSPNPTSRSPASVYAGFDPTAPSLHLGHASVIAMLVRMQHSFGLRPVALIGSATARIGDPSGRSATAADRPKLSIDTVAANAAGIKKNLERVFDFSSSRTSCAQPSFSPLLVDNADFYNSTSVIDFFSDVGRHFRVSSMLNKDSVKSRLGIGNDEGAENNINQGRDGRDSGGGGGGMSFSEFSYQVFQSSDFLHLFQRENCIVQIGGADQWGNITAGIELIRRSTQSSEISTSSPTTTLSSNTMTGDNAANSIGAHGLTVPLLTTASGVKFGKSEGNAIFLDESLTSNHAFFQFLLRTPDADVGNLLRQLTLLPDESIDFTLSEHLKNPEKKGAQLLLAESLTSLFRGQDAVTSAKKSGAILYGGTGMWSGENISPKLQLDGGSAQQAGSSSSSSGGGGGEFLPQRSLLHSLRASDLINLGTSGDVPMISMSMDAFKKSSIPSLCVAVGAVKSIGEGKRTLANGGIYLNWERAVNERKGELSEKDLVEGLVLVIGVGKKKTFLIRIQ
jgi:tyrosyl-tRNA synthetase